MIGCGITIVVQPLDEMDPFVLMLEELGSALGVVQNDPERQARI